MVVKVVEDDQCFSRHVGGMKLELGEPHYYGTCINRRGPHRGTNKARL